MPTNRDRPPIVSDESPKRALVASFNEYIASAIQGHAKHCGIAEEKEQMVSALIDQVFYGAAAVGYAPNDVMATLKARAEEFAKQSPYPNLIPAIQNWGRNVY